MAGGVYIGLDLGVKVNNAGGVGENLVVVQDANPYEGKLPAGANAAKILGVTIESSAATGRGVAVRMGGIAKVKAAGAIAVGDKVNVADAQGRIKTVDEAAATKVYLVGQALTAAANAGEIVDVLLSIGSVYTV